MGTEQKLPRRGPRTDMAGESPTQQLLRIQREHNESSAERADAALRRAAVASLAQGAELLLPAQEDPEVQAVLQILGGGLIPGRVYVFAYDRHRVSQMVMNHVLNLLHQQGIRVLALGTIGDPRAAIRIVDAAELDR